MVYRWKGFKDHWQLLDGYDEPEGPSHVGFLGRTGNLMLDLRFTESDPRRTFGAQPERSEPDIQPFPLPTYPE
jgi:hypothetical protein